VRLVTIGRNENGRSQVVNVRDVLADDIAEGGHRVDYLWSTHDSPPELGVLERRADEQPRPTSLRENTSAWTIAGFGPNRVGKMHCTDTLDYITVLAGSVKFQLEEGEIELQVGDAVLLPGLEHAWKAGPEGCVLNWVGQRPASGVPGVGSSPPITPT
jgi:hypothetical protein